MMTELTVTSAAKPKIITQPMVTIADSKVTAVGIYIGDILPSLSVISKINKV